MVTRKYGQDIVKIARKLEDLLTKHQKNGLDIKFIKTCKRENLTPTFATVNLAIKHGTMQLKKKIVGTIITMNLKKQILETSSQLKMCLSNIIYITVLHQISKAIKSKIEAVSVRRLKKLEKLCLLQNNVSPRKNNLVYLIHTISNMSSYRITHGEERALSFALGHHIPSKTDPHLIYTEFESYFQSIKHKITNLPETQISHLKTKLRNACEQYSNINVPNKEREIIIKLKKNQNIMLLRQDKGRGIVIIDTNRYTNTCLNILYTEQFQKLDRDPTKPIERRIQRAVRKIKSHLSNQEYIRIYPTGSAPGKFYGTQRNVKYPLMELLMIFHYIQLYPT